MFAMLHSPLVGPLTWSLVAEEMARRDIAAIVPRLRSPALAGVPYWELHVDAVAQALHAVPAKQPLVLVGHSGGGVLLPAIRQRTARPVAAYLFVDAMIPADGKSRLDLFEAPEAARQFRVSASGGLLPTWNDEDLRAAIPDAGLRRRFVAELQPLPLAVYEEPIPVFAGWPDAPCGYVRFGANPAYDAAAQQAQRQGWAYVRAEDGHFRMLVDPVAVTGTILDLVNQLGAMPPPEHKPF